MKRAISFILAVMMCLSLCACGSELTSGDLIGVWSGSWEYDGNQFNKSIEFNRDGSFIAATYKNNTLSTVEEGTYTIDGREVICDLNGPRIIYKYSGGKLENNGTHLSKE